MLLTDLLAPLLNYRLEQTAEVDIQSLTADSRQVRPGGMFVAIRGFTHDGHQFVRQAYESGAVAALVESFQPDVPMTQIVVPDTRFASAVLASQFYGHPSRKLQLIGVTGTNGKTTVTHLIESLLQNAGHSVGLAGTTGVRMAGRTIDVANTTPLAVDLQQILHEMVEVGCKYGVMEVSSHALEEHRVAGCRYHAAVFTNLTQDHLDFHGTMENYRAAKGKLFSRLGNEYGLDKTHSSYAILNADDPASAYMRSQTVAECITYGVVGEADVRAEDIQMSAEGTKFTLRTFRGIVEVEMPLLGRFNIYNALAAVSVGLVENIPLRVMAEALRHIVGVPGRLERVNAGQAYPILVDYAHTPDALENALHTVRECTTGRVICVVGCGGDRDKGKRPLMAEIACRVSDVAVLTSDNPRTENPDAILDDMEAGVQNQYDNYNRILDRRDAIFAAIQQASANDVVLIAGKGHETYQIVGTVKHHFDDREVAREAVMQQLS